MRFALVWLIALTIIHDAGASVRRFEITKATQVAAEIKFSLIIATRGDIYDVTVSLPGEQEALKHLWRTELWGYEKNGQEALSVPVEVSRDANGVLTARFSINAGLLNRSLIAVRCGEQAPLVETIYEIKLVTFLENK